MKYKQNYYDIEVYLSKHNSLFRIYKEYKKLKENKFQELYKRISYFTKYYSQ